MKLHFISNGSPNSVDLPSFFQKCIAYFQMYTINSTSILLPKTFLKDQELIRSMKCQTEEDVTFYFFLFVLPFVNRLIHLIIHLPPIPFPFQISDCRISFILRLSADYETNADRSTTHAVMSSCFDRRARPGGNDISACKLEMLRVRRTLFKTRRTMTSATVEFRRDPNGVARRVGTVPLGRLAPGAILRRFRIPCDAGGGPPVLDTSRLSPAVTATSSFGSIIASSVLVSKPILFSSCCCCCCDAKDDGILSTPCCVGSSFMFSSRSGPGASEAETSPLSLLLLFPFPILLLPSSELV